MDWNDNIQVLIRTEMTINNIEGHMIILSKHFNVIKWLFWLT